MKTILLFLCVAIVFTGCKKETDVAPQQPAQAVSGSYKLSSFYYSDGTDNINLPKLPLTQSGTTVSGTVELNPTGDDSVTMVLTLKATGQQDSSLDIDNIEVKKRSNGYGLYIDDQIVADADGDNIIFNISETAQSGEKLELKFNASK